ncbi:MAG: endonuclease [Chloroflexi bacterium]|nr:endonuclease [Chloroflexota bacterium]
MARAKGRGRRGNKPLSLPELYDRLFAEYGEQHWWPGETPFEVMVGAILTQNTAWTNVEKAISALREADVLNPKALRTRPLEDIAALIRPSGYFNAKALKLRALGVYLASYDDDIDKVFASKPLDELREELLTLHGVGPETADSMLLYAGNLPSFVIDAYTIRVLSRLGIIDPDSKPKYEDVRARFQESLPTDVQLFNEYHALFVAHGKDVCKSRKPLCSECVLVAYCPVGSSVTA